MPIINKNYFHKGNLKTAVVDFGDGNELKLRELGAGHKIYCSEQENPAGIFPYLLRHSAIDELGNPLFASEDEAKSALDCMSESQLHKILDVVQELNNTKKKN